MLGCDGLSPGLRSLLFGPANEFVLDLGYRVGGGHFHAPGIGGRLGGDVFLSDVKGEQFGMYAVDDDWAADFAVERSTRGLPEDPAAWIAGSRAARPARQRGSRGGGRDPLHRPGGPVGRAALAPRRNAVDGRCRPRRLAPRGAGRFVAIAGAVALGDALDSPTVSTTGSRPTSRPGAERSSRCRGARDVPRRPSSPARNWGCGGSASGRPGADRLQVRREALRWRADPLRHHEGPSLSHTVGA